MLNQSIYLFTYLIYLDKFLVLRVRIEETTAALSFFLICKKWVIYYERLWWEITRILVKHPHLERGQSLVSTVVPDSVSATRENKVSSEYLAVSQGEYEYDAMIERGHIFVLLFASWSVTKNILCFVSKFCIKIVHGIYYEIEWIKNVYQLLR